VLPSGAVSSSWMSKRLMSVFTVIDRDPPVVGPHRVQRAEAAPLLYF
jgi:hypothetical protein